MKKCVAVLTRGYEHFFYYSLLLERNKHIEENLIDKTIDILIFHEGNITEQHQIEIAQHTPLLKIIFLNIRGKAFKSEKENIQFYGPSSGFEMGYRHMCSFWFVDFWNFVSEYDYLVRIDEDCNIHSSIDDIFTKLNEEHSFISGMYEIDEPHVTHELNQFTIDFINRNSDSYIFEQNEIKDPSGGPYTNLYGIYLNNIRTNSMLLKYIQEIDSSNKIYEKRWGDLPLWGEVIDYITGKDTLFIDNTIKYYHSSHRKQVN